MAADRIAEPLRSRPAGRERCILRPMLLPRLLWVHGVSALSFAVAAAVAALLEPDSGMIGLYLSVGGVLFGLLAALASAVGFGLTVFVRERRREWPWLFAHAGALAGVVAVAGGWSAGAFD